jgi:drug/metabolite transporter (DMT)-like permease
MKVSIISKHELRPHLVKGVEAALIFMFYLLQSFFFTKKAIQDLQIWTGRLQVIRKRIIDAWMDTFQPDPPENPEFKQALQAENAGLQADGLAHTEASTSAFLTQAYCVILPLIACIRLRCPPGWRTLWATLLVIGGCAILSGIRPDALRMGRGEAETLLAALVFTLQILTLENPKYAKNRTLPVTFMMCLCIFVFMLPISILTAPYPAAVVEAGASWAALVLVAILAVCCSVAAFLLMNHWQPRISATEAGLIYTTEPVFTAIYVMFLPQWLAGLSGGSYANEVPGREMILGGGLILAANVLMQLRRSPHPPGMAPVP